MKLTVLSLMTVLAGSLQGQQWHWAQDLGKYDFGYPRHPYITTNSAGDLFIVSDNGHMTNDYSTTSTIRRVDPSGTLKYIDSLRGNHMVFSAFADNSNNLLVCGQFQYSLTASDTMVTMPGNPVSFIACFDPAGNRKWIRINNSWERFVVHNAPGGGYYLSGQHGALEKLDAKGNAIWKKSLQFELEPGEPYWLQGSSSDLQGNILMWGSFRGDILKIDGNTYFHEVNGPWSNSFFLRFDPQGALQNVEIMRDCGISGVKQDAFNNIYVMGAWENDHVLRLREDSLTGSLANCYVSTFLAKLKPDNTCEWLHEIQQDCYPYFEDAYRFDVNANGNIFVLGSTAGPLKYHQSTIPLSAGLFVMKMDAGGNHVWARQASSANGNIETVQIAAGNNNAVYIASTYSVDFTYGTNTISTSHNRAQLVALIDDGSITGIEKDQFVSASFAPNPCDGTFNIIADEKIAVDAISDQLGRAIKFNADPLSGAVQLDNCAPGVYFVRLRKGGAEAVHKLIVR